LDSSTLVFDSPDDQFGVLSDPEHEPLVQEGEIGIRRTEEREVDDRSIQSIWLSHITADWSPESVALLGQSFAESTLKNYNQELEKYFSFCSQRGADPLTGSKAVIAEYLETRTRGLDHPHSTVKKVSAALNAIYKPLGISSLDDVLIRHLKASIVKNRTTVPSRPKLPLPTDKITDYFRELGDNADLDLYSLRSKTIALLALCLLLRPKDVTCLRANHVIDEDGRKLTLGEGGFPGLIKLVKFKFKNDWNSNGAWLPLFTASESELCPIAALWEYCHRTRYHHRGSNHIFLDVSRPFAPVKVRTVSKLLSEVIKNAGIDWNFFSARHFCSGGATALIKGGVRPDIVMKLGAWRCVQTFFTNYVATEEPLASHFDLLFAE